MIKLTHNEAQTYEGLKAGLLSEDIALKNHYGVATIRHHIRFLEKVGMVKQSGSIDRKYTYEAIDQPYEIQERELTRRDIVESEIKDTLITRAMNLNLPEDTLFFLKHNKHKTRSYLKKRTGLSRLALCFALERMQA